MGFNEMMYIKHLAQPLAQSACSVVTVPVAGTRVQESSDTNNPNRALCKLSVKGTQKLLSHTQFLGLVTASSPAASPAPCFTVYSPIKGFWTVTPSLFSLTLGSCL